MPVFKKLIHIIFKDFLFLSQSLFLKNIRFSHFLNPIKNLQNPTLLPSRLLKILGHYLKTTGPFCADMPLKLNTRLLIALKINSVFLIIFILMTIT